MAPPALSTRDIRTLQPLYIPPTYPATLTLTPALPTLDSLMLDLPPFLSFFLSFFPSLFLSFQPSPRALVCFNPVLALFRVSSSLLSLSLVSRSASFFESLASAYCLFNSVSGSPRLLYRATVLEGCCIERTIR